MQYMLLIYADETKSPKPGQDNFEAFMGDYFAFTEKVTKSGQFVAGDGLAPVATATTVSVRDGKIDIVDGPFAETKEQFGGYYLIEAKDLDEAAIVAAEIPTAKYGRIEIRPVMIYNQD